MSAHVNTITTSTGKLRPVCEFCGRLGRAVEPDGRGSVSVLDLGHGWAVAPYPADHVHWDGSTGDLFECPDCRRRLARGESLRSRGEDVASRTVRASLESIARLTYTYPVECAHKRHRLWDSPKADTRLGDRVSVPSSGERRAAAK